MHADAAKRDWLGTEIHHSISQAGVETVWYTLGDYTQCTRLSLILGVLAMTWNDADRWSALCSRADCPICQRGKPLNIAAELEGSWLTMAERAPVRGYVCLVSKIHAVELHHLTDATGTVFMRDARRVSAAVAASTGAIKLNYEIHGNSLPHFPRYRGDQFEGQPINPSLVTQCVYVADEFRRIRDDFLRILSAPSLMKGKFGSAGKTIDPP